MAKKTVNYSLPIKEFDLLITKYSPEVNVIRKDSARMGVDKRKNVVLKEDVVFQAQGEENISLIDTFLSETR